jgi:carboxylesterase
VPERDAFALDGDGAVGVVLVHGFTGTPYEVRYLGEQLAVAGFSVVAPRLPGHGTKLADLDATTWQDWVAHVDHTVDQVATRYPRVAIVGQSLGGLLSLYVASRRRDLVCVASLAAPLWLAGISARVSRWVVADKLRIKAIPKFGGSDVLDARSRAENPCYPAIPTAGLKQLMAFMPVVDAALANVTQPVLVLHARQDHTAPVACAARIAEATRAVRMRILPRSYHLIAVDVERDIVAAEVIQHVTTYTKEKPCAT